MIVLKRACDAALRTDGDRILVERHWPRGGAEGEASNRRVAASVAPSTALRKWFSHDPNTWESRRRYVRELRLKPPGLRTNRVSSAAWQSHARL